MNRQLINFILAGLVSISSLPAQEWKVYPYQEAGSVLSFPEDEGHHPGEPIEWWYTNARVTGEDTGHEYSLMLTYFDYPALTFDGFRILNLANETTGEFFDETLPCTYSTLAQDQLEIKANVLPFGNEEWVTAKDETGNLIPFEYHISAGGQYGSIDLDFKTVKRPLMVGGTGFLYQGIDNYTYYYSQTGVEVTGTLSIGDITEPVSGTAWIDRQWGDFNPNTGEAYEWFSLQLSNGMDINLWNIFTDDDRIPDTSTYRYLSAYIDESSSLTTSDFQLERLGYAWMPDGEVCYAQQWRILSAALDADLTLTTRYSDHEVALPFRFYEGTTIIEGTVGGQEVTGNGFAELLHHYDHPEMEFTYPTGEQPWDPSVPLSWQLLNPDDGRPVYYDLEVSVDNRETYYSIAGSLPTNEFIWNPVGYPPDSLYWFRVTGYSIDGTLMGTAETQMAYPLVTSSSENEWAGIKVFPNPASDLIFIGFDSPARGKIKVELSTLSGRILNTIDSGNREWIEVDVRGLPSGFYFLKLKTNTRHAIYKVVVK